MKKLRHKNLIQLFEVIDNPNNDKLFMGIYYLIISIGVCWWWI